MMVTGPLGMPWNCANAGPVDEFVAPLGWDKAEPGGTFIKIGVETIPPVTFIAARTFIAGGLLLAVLRGEPWVGRPIANGEWRWA